jgi:hypothetical protein
MEKVPSLFLPLMKEFKQQVEDRGHPNLDFNPGFTNRRRVFQLEILLNLAK